MKKTITLLFIITTLINVTTSAAIYKVGTAWGENADYTTLQELITTNVGKATDDEIWIAGEHILDDQWNISGWASKIYGGFAGTEISIEERKTVAGGRGWEFINPTVLSENTKRERNSIMFSGSSTGSVFSLIDGIHFDATNCAASPLFLRQFSSSGITVRNCVFENADLPTNNVMNPGTTDYEAGAINMGSDDALLVRNIVIEECLIQNNKARVGAIMARQATIKNCIIINNTGVDAGKSGGLYARDAFSVENTVFWNNKIGETISNANANGKATATANNIIDKLDDTFLAASGNIAESDVAVIFSPKKITISLPGEVSVISTSVIETNGEYIVKLGACFSFTVSAPEGKTIKAQAGTKEISVIPGTTANTYVVNITGVMQNTLIGVYLNENTDYVPEKATTDAIDWENFLRQHDMYWTSISADPTDAKYTHNNLKTGYYAGALMGNGLIGTNMYKLKDNVYRLNTGRSDVTEIRKPYGLFNSARLPIGYFTLATVGEVALESMYLSLYNATTKGTFITDKGKINFKTYVHSLKNYIVFETETTGDETNYVWDFVAQKAISPRCIQNGLSAANEGYLNSENKSNPDAVSKMDGDYHLLIQELVTDNTFATVGKVYVVAWKEVKNGTKRRVIATITQQTTEEEAIEEAKSLIDAAFAEEAETLENSHKQWWNDFYQKAAFVSFPNTRFESFYWAQYYKFASTTREDKPIVDLQGVWPTANTPWTTIWVNLNLQLTYSWQTKANLGFLAQPLWNSLYDNFDNLRANTDLMAAEKGETWTDAAVLPRTSTYDLRASLNPAGRNNNQYEVGNLAWTLFYYWQHCVAYGDEDALKNKLFPLLKEAVNTFIYIRTEKDGKYGLPVTASPEYVNTSAGENTNYDLANLRFGLMTLIDIDNTYNINDPLLDTWKDFLDNLVDFQIDANGYRISSTIGIPTEGTSHRHYSHLFMLYPYHMVDWEDSGEQAALLNTSLSKWNGNQGYSRTGKAAMLASKGDGEGALSQMTTFFNTFIKPNTLYSETGPVIETPFAAVSTLHEFYMQDWGDRIRIYYGLPTSWKEASFINMRAKGAFLVSATRKGGKTVFIQIESEKGGLCRLQTGIQGSNIKVLDLDGNNVTFNLTNPDNGIIEVNTQSGDIFQVIDITEEAVLPYAIEHPFNETMPYGVNNGPHVEITSLTFTNATETLTESDPSKYLTVKAEPNSATIGKLIWTTSNPEVVRLQNGMIYGLIQAIIPGEAEITATNIDGASAKCTVTVAGNNFSSYISIPDDDTYAYDSSAGKTTSHGDESIICVKLDGSGYNRMGFFKFPIDDINKYAAEGYSSKIEAFLYINSAGTTAGNTSWQFFAVPDLTWTESTLTWDNKPAVSTNKLAEIEGRSNVDDSSYSESNRMSFDITDYATAQYNAGNKKIAFNATQKNIVSGGAHSSYFASKDHSESRRIPYIKVTKGDKTTDIQNPDNFHISIHPTITDGTVFLTSDIDAAYCIYDISGRVIFRDELPAFIQKEVDLRASEKGMYILKIKNKTYKIIYK